MSYREVYQKFEEYYQKHKLEEVYFNKGQENIQIKECQTPTPYYLHLYHKNTFDDVQLQVWFDENGRVCRIWFIGD